MGNRLSKIYTRTGDAGTTGLGDGQRVEKDSLRVAAMGTVDELNCAIGMVLVYDIRPPLRETLNEVQHKLFDLGGELCMPGYAALNPDDIAFLEQELDHYNADLPPLKEFILPGGGPAAAACHLARAICRRTERVMVSLARAESDALSDHANAYVNRLSDLLFVICRVLARDEGGSEVLWRHDRQRRKLDPTTDDDASSA